MKMIQWFKAWQNLNFTVMFNDKYSKEYDIFLNDLINNGVILHKTPHEISIVNNSGEVFNVWISNKFFGYASRCMTSYYEAPFDNVRPSVVTMSKLYNLERLCKEK